MISNSIGKLLQLMSRFGKIKIEGINMDENSTSHHYLAHKFRNEIIVPWIAVSNNVAFAINKGKHIVTTADNIRCVVSSYDEKHICDMEQDIKRLYNMDAWSFVKRWHGSYPDMDNMHFLILKLEKEE